MHFKKKALASAALMTTTTFAMAAQLEEMIVTAEHRDESVMEVPVAITALSEEFMRNSGLNSPVDVGSVTPGLVTTESVGSFTPYIRGVGSRNNTPGNESPVATYVDEVYQYLPAALNLSSFSDVRSIEILRGPQGTLFGRNATGGAVRISTYDPSQEFGGRLEATYGGDKKSISGYVTGGFTDTLSAIVSAYKEENEAYIRNLNPSNGAGSKVGDSDSYAVRTKILWEPTADFSALLSTTHSNLEDNAKTALQTVEGTPLSTAEVRGGVPITRNDKRVYAGDVPPTTYVRSNEYSLKLNAAFDSFDLVSITAYTEIQNGLLLDADASPLGLTMLSSNLGSHAFQQEARLVSNTDGDFNWLAGAFYYDNTAGYNRGGDLGLINGVTYPGTLQQLAALPAPAGAGTIIFHHSNVNVQSQALFGEVDYAFTDVTKLTLGLRYTDETHELDSGNHQTTLRSNGAGGYTTTVATVAQSCAAAPACDGLDNSFEEWTYRSVLNHNFTDDWMGYVSYNRGFKSGAYVLSQSTEWRPTEPEIIDAYEIGAKGHAFDNSVQLTAALYYYKYKDMQQSLTDPQTATGRIINASSASISGMEVDMLWSATDDLTVQLGGATTFKAEYDDFNNCEVWTANASGAATTVKADCSGTQLLASPDYSVYLSVNYQAFTFGDGSRLAIGGVLDYTDDYQYLPEPKSSSGINTLQPEQEGVETLNAYVRWTSADDKYFINVYGSNLTDTDKLMGISATTRGVNSQYTRGREYGATVGVKF